MKKNIHATVELTKQGFSGYVEMEGGIIVSDGETLEELKINLKGALALHIEDLKTEGINVQKLENCDIDLNLDVKALFEMLSSINVTGFANYSGMNRSLLGQYLTGKKSPSEKQSKKILANVNKLGEQLASIHY
mgnify:CR=1 FL=1